MPKVKPPPRSPASATDTRSRIVAAGRELFRHHGYAGTGVKAIVEASEAPYGSVYHFFPGGKEELGVAALTAGGVTYRELVELVFAEGVDLVAATRDFFAGAAAVLRDTSYTDACPIATMALEIASSSEPMRAAAADTFESWLAVLEQRFTAAGLSTAAARELAVELFCAIEAAFLLARTERSIEALEVMGIRAAASVQAALET